MFEVLAGDSTALPILEGKTNARYSVLLRKLIKHDLEKALWEYDNIETIIDTLHVALCTSVWRLNEQDFLKSVTTSAMLFLKR
jgi:hypothetical protein